MKKDCIFISAGDNERFASYATEKMRDRYEVVVNYYGDDTEKIKRLRDSSSEFVQNKTTKFISLKMVYDQLIRDKYEWVAVFDDDAKFISGSIDDLVSAGKEFSLDLVSGSHHYKISHPDAHLLVEGDHRIRYVNFIEMNFPVFRQEALAKYMEVYDGRLCGWGNDWWYCSVLQVNQKNNAAIVDSVQIENPENEQMNAFMGRRLRELQWMGTMERLGLREWEIKTLGFAR